MANITILSLSISILKQKFIDSIGTHSILTKLTNIHWLNLKSLYLDRNRITNIQPLTLIQDLQNLKTLSLSNNFITNIKCLRKLQCKKLNLLVLGMSYLLYKLQTAIMLHKFVTSCLIFHIQSVSPQVFFFIKILEYNKVFFQP